MSQSAFESLLRFGYTDREATFLYLVAVHSGYFLRRQFIECVHRERGGVATNFLRKAMELHHVTALPCNEGRFIYHLHGKQVYRALDQSDSQNRRLKSTAEIRRRLIALDYVLLHLGRERFIESEQARQQLWTSLKAKPEAINRAATFLQGVPVSILEADETFNVRFAFVDEAQRSISRYLRFLDAYHELIRSLERVEIAYVSPSPINFTSARRLFDQHMPLRNLLTPACPLGVEHLVRWLEIQHRFHHGHGSIVPAEHQLFLEGERVYRAPIHQGLIASWGNGVMDADKVRKLFSAEKCRTLFVTELIRADYPRLLSSGAGKTEGNIRGQTPLQEALFDNEIADSEGNKYT
jgi:hypothetical protein